MSYQEISFSLSEKGYVGESMEGNLLGFGFLGTAVWLQVVVGVLRRVEVVLPEEMNGVGAGIGFFKESPFDGSFFVDDFQFDACQVVDGHFHLDVLCSKHSLPLLIFWFVFIVEVEQAGLVICEFSQFVGYFIDIFLIVAPHSFQVGHQQVRELHEDVEVDVAGSLLVWVFEHEKGLISNVGFELFPQSFLHILVSQIQSVHFDLSPEAFLDFVHLDHYFLFELRVVGQIGHNHYPLILGRKVLYLEFLQLT